MRLSVLLIITIAGLGLAGVGYLISEKFFMVIGGISGMFGSGTLLLRLLSTNDCETK